MSFLSRGRILGLSIPYIQPSDERMMLHTYLSGVKKIALKNGSKGIVKEKLSLILFMAANFDDTAVTFLSTLLQAYYVATGTF